MFLLTTSLNKITGKGLGRALQALQSARLLSLSVVYDLQHITGGKTLQWCITNKSLEYCHLRDGLHEHIAKCCPSEDILCKNNFLGFFLFFMELRCTLTSLFLSCFDPSTVKWLYSIFLHLVGERLWNHSTASPAEWQKAEPHHIKAISDRVQNKGRLNIK